MDKNASVSVIIPCYNGEKFIGDALASIRQQTYEDWSCLVIDDGSTDQTREVISNYCQKDIRISCIFQENRGLPGARNTGLRHAKGAFIQFLDMDDVIEPRKLEFQVAYLVQHPEVDIVYGDATYFRVGEDGQRDYSVRRNLEPWMPKVSGAGRPILKELLKRNIMVVSSPLVRRSVFDRCGLFAEDLTYGYEDWEFWIRCTFKDIHFAYVHHPETATLIRCHAAQMSQKRIGMLETNLQIRKRLGGMLTALPLRMLNRWGSCKVQVMLALEKMKRVG